VIPDIGLMIAVYIIARLTAMLGQSSEQTNVVAKVFSGIAILVTVISVIDLLSHGNSVPQLR
jgi:hypothetical protein